MFVFFNVQAANAADPWNLPQKVLAGLYVGAVAIDYGQTKYALFFESPYRDQFMEANPLIGNPPTMTRVKLIFAASLTAPLVAAHFMPSNWRTAFLSGMTAFRVFVVVHNAGEGEIGVQFPF